MEAMRTYRQSPFGASLSDSPVTVGLVAINVLVYLLLELTGGSQNNVTLYRWGAKFGPAIADGEWWRLVLPMFMHIGLFHLLTNSLGLLIFGSMAERVFGSVAYLAIYLMAGVIGNVASFLITPAMGAGASGAVFGIIGAFAVYLLLNRRLLGEVGRQSLTTVAVIVGINIVIGMITPGIDNAAHMGGLLAGAFMAYLISPRQRLVITPGWGEFGPPRMQIRDQAQRSFLLLLAIAAGAAIAVIGTTVKSSNYSEPDIFANCNYKFLDFSSEPPRFQTFCP